MAKIYTTREVAVAMLTAWSRIPGLAKELWRGVGESAGPVANWSARLAFTLIMPLIFWLAPVIAKLINLERKRDAARREAERKEVEEEFFCNAQKQEGEHD